MAWVQCIGWRSCKTRIREGQKGFDGWCSRCRQQNNKPIKPPRSRAANGRRSKGKGARGELQVIKVVQPWWSRLEPEAVFVRTPGSGGWRHAPAFKARGDLLVDPQTTKFFPFSIECKWQEGWGTGLLFGVYTGKRQGDDSSPIWGWWAQCCEAARVDGLRPMLWFRKNGSPWYVMIEESVFDCLRLRGMTPPLVRFGAPRHTVVLSHAQTIWIPPRAFVAACNEVAETKLAASYGFEGLAR